VGKREKTFSRKRPPTKKVEKKKENKKELLDFESGKGGIFCAGRKF